mgnify:CR=1 FL=1
MKLSISVFLVSRLNEPFEFEVAFLVDKLMELRGQLHNLKVSDAHLGQNFLQTIQLDHAGLVVLARQ